jgi:hypothetical protein
MWTAVVAAASCTCYSTDSADVQRCTHVLLTAAGEVATHVSIHFLLKHAEVRAPYCQLLLCTSTTDSLFYVLPALVCTRAAVDAVIER